MKKIMLIFPLLLLLGKVGAQNHTITGNVTGEDGESLPGVNILEKGTIKILRTAAFGRKRPFTTS
jgi:hypothetical protein